MNGCLKHHHARFFLMPMPLLFVYGLKRPPRRPAAECAEVSSAAEPFPVYIREGRRLLREPPDVCATAGRSCASLILMPCRFASAVAYFADSTRCARRSPPPPEGSALDVHMAATSVKE